MPPKKPPATSKKNENKKKDKVIDDKTFGLKNKKGGKNQKFIAQVEKQVKAGGNPEFKKSEQLRAEQIKKKMEEQKKLDEMSALFNPVVSQKVDAGVDPKSVFCAFFKQGLCKKPENKCKFSHDPAVEKKAAKRNMFENEKDTEEDEDNMDDWDDDKLADVISKKHGAEKSNETDIICKHFLDAVESNRYGWFWECPAGGKTCKYKHALPKGYVLKKDKRKAEKEGEETSLEDLIEKERANLDTTKLTKVNLETFVAWKKKKFREKKMAEEKLKIKKKTDMKSGKTGGMSGKDIFTFNPSVLSQQEGAEEDDDGGDFDYEREEEDVGVKVHEIKFDEYGIMDDGLDDSTATQLARNKAERAAEAGPSGAAAAATEIDEDLFDDEDLDDLEEELDDLNI